MTVRVATFDDMPALLEMGTAFFAVSGFGKLCDLDEPAFADFMAAAIDAEDKGVLVATSDDGGAVGMAAAIATPTYFNPDYKSCSELFWWVAPGHRRSGVGLDLLNAVTEWARAAGCKSLLMVALENGGTPSIARKIYERLEYTPLETTFYKEL